jgi:hypothetical protein
MVSNILYAFGYVTNDVVDIAAEGTKTIVTGTANEINKGLTSIQEIGDNNAPSIIKPTDVSTTIANKADIMQTNTLNKALNTSAASRQAQSDYAADDSNSKIQTGSNKAGWCYIGEDRGFRTCAQVGVNDQCMSGDIFPSNEICINPSLRA